MRAAESDLGPIRTQVARPVTPGSARPAAARNDGHARVESNHHHVDFSISPIAHPASPAIQLQALRSPVRRFAPSERMRFECRRPCAEVATRSSMRSARERWGCAGRRGRRAATTAVHAQVVGTLTSNLIASSCSGARPSLRRNGSQRGSPCRLTNSVSTVMVASEGSWDAAAFSSHSKARSG